MRLEFVAQLLLQGACTPATTVEIPEAAVSPENVDSFGLLEQESPVVETSSQSENKATTAIRSHLTSRLNNARSIPMRSALRFDISGRHSIRHKIYRQPVRNQETGLISNWQMHFVPHNLIHFSEYLTAASFAARRIKKFNRLHRPFR